MSRDHLTSAQRVDTASTFLVAVASPSADETLYSKPFTSHTDAATCARLVRDLHPQLSIRVLADGHPVLWTL